ncbi:MAG: hypothetical protein V3U57_08565 [Robiginitomaculum sp.]
MTTWIQGYNDNGAAVIRSAPPMACIESMRGAIQDILDNPMDASLEYTEGGKLGRYYGDFFIWRKHEVFHEFMSNFSLPKSAKKLKSARAMQFFYGQLLIKESGTQESGTKESGTKAKTPWYQNQRRAFPKVWTQS